MFIKKNLRLQPALYIMILPCLLITLVYSYGPMVGLCIAFQRFDITKGLFGSEWIGFENFKYALSLPNFWQVFYNTLYISVSKLVLGIVVPVIISIMINEVNNKSVKRSIQTAIYLPHFISWVIISGVLIDMLSTSTGIFNNVIRALGGETVNFLGDKKVFPNVLIFSSIWKEFGFGTIIFLAALTNIDPSLYEAASIDGAGRFRRIWSITLPSLLPIIMLVTTLRLGNILGAGFDQVVNLYSPLVYETGDIIDTLVYRLGMESTVPQYELATTIGLFKSVISFVLVAASYFTAYKYADYRIF